MSERALKQLVGALAIVAAVWLLASFFSGGDGAIGATGEIGATFEGLDETSVTTVRFIGPDATVELVRGADTWRVNGFRADSGSVARFFESVAETSVGDLMATNPSNHDRMGVSGDSTRTLEIEAGGPTRTLLVGNEGPRPSTAYVRLPGQDEVYLLEGGIRPHLTRRLDDWRNRKMLAIDTSLVTRIAIQRDESAFTLVRADTAWTFEGGGAATQSQVQSILAELGGSLVASRFVPDGDSLAAFPQTGATVAYSASSDVLAEVTIGGGTGDHWAMAAGDSVRYRIASFRANLIVPTLESVRPRE